MFVNATMVKGLILGLQIENVKKPLKSR